MAAYMLQKQAWIGENTEIAVCPKLELFTIVSFTEKVCWLLVLVQFSSVTQLCLILCDPMNRSTPGLPVKEKQIHETNLYVIWFDYEHKKYSVEYL